MKKGKIYWEKDAVKMMMENYIANNNLEEMISRTIDQLIYGHLLEDVIMSEMDDMGGCFGVDITDDAIKFAIIKGIKEELTRTLTYDNVIESIAEYTTDRMNTAKEEN